MIALARRWAVRVEVGVAVILEAAARHEWGCLGNVVRSRQRRDQHQRVVLVLSLCRLDDAEDDVLVVWYYRVGP